MSDFVMQKLRSGYTTLVPTNHVAAHRISIVEGVKAEQVTLEDTVALHRFLDTLRSEGFTIRPHLEVASG